jgi:pyruvate dehydrogenase E1 component alpha subunit
MGAHTTSDDPTRYRIAAEVEAWKLKDPIERLRSYLVRYGKADQAWFEALEQESDELAKRIRSGCLEMPDPEPLSMFDHVYVEPTRPLAAQRDQFAAYLASFEGVEEDE